ncbi:GerMN domain-containing protein [Anaerosporobacter sp.]|uniref:GerMN domain-containing protein n=1 Tax=Anaerosporobacter sp. TaxID=1872529 RepID=UPI00286EE493|nr:GerMN domain-containing protein [Anaerosporobacter sp.]
MKKRKISVLIAIAVISILAVTGCKKKGSVENNNLVKVNDTIDSNEDVGDTNIDATEDGIDDSEQGQDGATDVSSDVEKQGDTTDETPLADVDKTPEDEDGKKGTESESTKEEIKISIYTINDETLEAEDAIAYVSGDTKITAEVIVAEVVKAFSTNSYEVKIESVSQEGDAVIVNFKKDSAPIVGAGSSIEITTLDCISYSLLDNLSTCKKVIFRVEGEAYASGHISFKINEPYITGNTN